MEVLSIINTLAKDLLATSPNMKIGQISVINPRSSKSNPHIMFDVDKYKKNLSVLVKAAEDPTLSYNLDKFKTINFLDIL